jgi:cysteine synthase A
LHGRKHGRLIKTLLHARRLLPSGFASAGKIVEVDDGDSIIMAQKLATSLGLGVGISSGGNFLGAVKLQHETPDVNIVTVFSDCNKKYLLTDYGKQEPVKDGFLSTDIELISKETIR